MSIVRVKDNILIERSVNTKTGPQIFREQRACVVMGGAYETVFNLKLGTASVYSPGDYLIHPDSYGTDDYANLLLKRLKLIPLSSALKEFASKEPVSVVSSKVS
ncbi:single-stranded DNA-binding protein [Xylella fastidiosa]|uniref:single-stranded DNA-binding protein n=1 Tax=Xylella fastidiosa TaxID=2371 RepID=UPI0012B361ED|nr:single-stranded DNA-binding protein [Xylella fastidiosa]MDC6413599.1 G5P family DNA-binding protein [Xylella fastidiosa subsp. multiplex]MDC6413988.1 G5P family DNA-binding protein [Xylella fastidiosa subsp. multiplex]MDD0864386.1 G5P family DNA-binding protein [Xylella fastidiosa subsp. multiplex]MDD0866499.1 G5P family DNA-binding protein [Xylella fastidiosa subsp. multiplex]MDD0873446.1 G5P family DNA-binding protein [Xylella fastidiosa subsp. multiplex]